MSVQTIKQQVLDFLGSPSPGTMSIRGAWGVGKTHAWKEYIKQARSENILEHNERYSYVSLFGIDSLQDLKFQIFQQAIPTKMIGEEVTIKSFGENVLQLSESFGRKSFRSLFQLPYITNFSDSLQAAAFLSVSKSLICIDDLERKGKNLSMTDVLGLVSLLKEEKGCKVVLIHNEDALGEDQAEFDKYREKVIDIEFKYKPSSSECTSIAFSGSCDFHEDLIHNCNRLGIDNIRILKKIEVLTEQLLPHVQNFEPEILVQSLHTLCLYTWCFYSPDDVSPKYDYVTNITTWMMGLADNDKYTEEQKQWNAALQNYGYVLTDELDLAIGHLIETGYINEDDFYRAASKKNEEVIASKGDKSFRDAWDIYHNNFRNSEEEVIEQLLGALKKWVKYVSPLNLQGTVGVLRELQRNDLADEAIEYYIEQRKSETELFDLQEYPFSGEITDETIRNRFQETFESMSGIKTRSLEEVVSKIADKDGWSQEDEQILATATTEDYYKLFKSTEGSRLSKYINACLQFGRFGNASEQQKEISNKAISALKMIGKEAPINKLRVKKFGVHVD